MEKYQATTDVDKFKPGKFAVHYITDDYSVVISDLSEVVAKELARLMNSSGLIYFNGRPSNDHNI